MSETKDDSIVTDEDVLKYITHLRRGFINSFINSTTECDSTPGTPRAAIKVGQAILQEMLDNIDLLNKSEASNDPE